MDTSKLKKFAQYARRSLIEQVESKLKLVLAEESEARREHPSAVAELEKKLKELGLGKKQEHEVKQELIEQVAYTWFNRFCALRFMDVNQYNRIMVISPLAGQFQPEILAEAKAGHIDEGMVNAQAREKIFGLLRGSVASRDGQAEAFRLLIVAVCNDLHRIMPYLFERIEDYTELLMPDDLLSGNSILAYTREAMTPEACESVESIGWLYQFYISEKKDEVFDGLKKNKKITPENIPAATQLFTPHWIVRYLVENSLGRLWMLNNPSSKVIEQMDYYIKPASAADGSEQEEDFLKISSPEEIKICDPACGSGHMLTYAYDLLYSIYLDAGYDPTEIPEKILTNNLYGIEIDERAAELAAFALTMKAIKGDPNGDGNNRRRFFRNPVEPNICRLEKVSFTEQELDSYIDFVGKDLFTQDLKTTLKEFEEADNFGSLIQPTLKNPADVLAALEAKDVSGQLFLTETHKSVLKVIKQTDYLSSKYHVVVANPPYMGSRNMNAILKSFAQKKYPESKADLFAMFIETTNSLSRSKGYSALVTMQAWMFLSSFEKLRSSLLAGFPIINMAHMGRASFDGLSAEIVSTTAFVCKKNGDINYPGIYIRSTKFVGERAKSEATLGAIHDRNSELKSIRRSKDFCRIPGEPIAYWVSESTRNAFEKSEPLSMVAYPRQGMATTNNDRFLRRWYEVSKKNSFFNCPNGEVAKQSEKKWFPYNKGGGYRKWAGNADTLVNFYNDGHEICEYIDTTPGAKVGSNGRVINRDKYFLPSVTWSDIGASNFGVRHSPGGFIFDVAGSSAFPEERKLANVAGFLNSITAHYFLSILNPTMHFQVGNIASLPFSNDAEQADISAVNSLIEMSQSDWDAYETSWDFTTLSLLQSDYRAKTLETTYTTLRTHWQGMTNEMQRLEEVNNRTFINAYNLQDELTPEVPLNEITLTCNPAYRYGMKISEENRETRLRADTMAEFLSYAVGCMLGRYSLDKKGLILANQGETVEDYLKQVPQPTFMPDDDNVIPLIDFDGDWFEDDITERFKEFLKVTFGEEHFAENLAFIEEALGGDGKRKDIKKFFLKDFYADHVKRYKKRPIYWMFSSPKGSFNALIYMHRYNKDTVSIVLNDYLREFRTKLQARKESHEQIELSASASAKEKTLALKAIQKINKVLDEINDYEHDTLYPLAGKPPEIDLDDGVKHNYPLFGKALKKVTGLS